MNTSRRKLILGFFIFLGVMIAAATGVLIRTQSEVAWRGVADVR